MDPVFFSISPAASRHCHLLALKQSSKASSDFFTWEVLVVFFLLLEDTGFMESRGFCGEEETPTFPAKCSFRKKSAANSLKEGKKHEC